MSSETLLCSWFVSFDFLRLLPKNIQVSKITEANLIDLIRTNYSYVAFITFLIISLWISYNLSNSFINIFFIYIHGIHIFIFSCLGSLFLKMSGFVLISRVNLMTKRLERKRLERCTGIAEVRVPIPASLNFSGFRSFTPT